MIELLQNTGTRVWVRLRDEAGAARAGVTAAAVSLTVWRADGTTADYTLDAAGWQEVTDGAFASTGTYTLQLPAAALSVAGPLMYAVKVSGSDAYVGAMDVKAPPAEPTPTPPYVRFTSNGATQAPVIQKVVAPTRTSVHVTFSAAMLMDSSANGALNPGNYTIPGLTLLAASVVDAQTVQLTTSLQAPATLYNLTVTGVRDVDGQPVAS